jgi:hypothetical protein
MLFALLLATGLLGATGVAFAQGPGSPSGICFPPPPAIDIVEGPLETIASERSGPIPTPCSVLGGYVVLVESPDPALHPVLHNWSDVVAFTTGGPVQPGQPTDHYYFLSDSPDPVTGVENGMTPADLAAAGLTQADILSNPTTVFIVEGLNAANPDVNDYMAGQIHYLIHSDRPEPPTATRSSTWGRLKILYR